MIMNYDNHGAYLTFSSPMRVLKAGTQNPSVELDELVQERLTCHSDETYLVAMEHVMDADPDLAERYNESPSTLRVNNVNNQGNVRDIVDKAICAYQDAHPDLDYSEAMERLFEERPKIKQSYANS